MRSSRRCERVAAQAEAGFPAALERLELLSGSRSSTSSSSSSRPSRPSGTRPASSKRCGALLDRIADLAESITADTIREPIEELVDIVQVDFGLTPDFLDDEVRTLFDDAVARLEDIPATADADARSNRLAVARALRRLRNRTPGRARLPGARREPPRRRALPLARAHRSSSAPSRSSPASRAPPRTRSPSAGAWSSSSRSPASAPAASAPRPRRATRSASAGTRAG